MLHEPIASDVKLQLPVEGHETNSHHNVPRSRGGASNFFNEKPVDPERHSLWHDFADNKLPTEAIRMAAISGIGRNGLTIDPQRLETIFQITTLLEWHKLYVPQAVVPSGSHRSLSRSPHLMFRHTTEQIQEESAAIRYALNGLETGKGFPYQKTFYGKQFRKFFRTQDTTESIALALTEQHKGERTWVGAMAEETRYELMNAVVGAEDVQLTNPIRKELTSVLEDQYGYMEKHGAIWRDAYEANYGQRSRKKKRAETARRGRGGRR